CPSLKHLVLTLKNVPGLTWSSVDQVRQYFTRLRHRQLFKAAWRGGVYGIEFTWTGDKGWHIHIHALIDGDYIPQAVISRHWFEITGDSQVVWITRSKNSRQALYTPQHHRHAKASLYPNADFFLVVKLSSPAAPPATATATQFVARELARLIPPAPLAIFPLTATPGVPLTLPDVRSAPA
ncbi:unnamed protein product, partial [marine sediment metagenome]